MYTLYMFIIPPKKSHDFFFWCGWDCSIKCVADFQFYVVIVSKCVTMYHGQH